MKISIVTVCFNSEETIGFCLRSVANQTWADIEHIVVDGASSDGTLKEIEANKHTNLSLSSEPDEGIYDAMNKGLQMASGDYIAFLNSDDLYADDDAVKWVVEKAKETDADCILGNVQFFDDNPSEARGRFYSSNRFAKWWIKIGMMPPHPGFFAKRSMLIKAGGFDKSYKIAADFDLVARVILKHDASWASVRKTVALFRTGGVSTEGSGARAILSAEAARSLTNLNVSMPRVRVMFRFPVKVFQCLPFWAQG